LEELNADRPFAPELAIEFLLEDETEDPASSSSVGADPPPLPRSARSSFGVFSCNFFRRLTGSTNKNKHF
jgi:hypothetical protein